MEDAVAQHQEAPAAAGAANAGRTVTFKDLRPAPRPRCQPCPSCAFPPVLVPYCPHL